MDLKQQIKMNYVLNELIQLKKLSHPNLVAFIDSFFLETKRNLKIVTEFMDGGALTDVAEQIVMSEPQIAAISFEVLKGLDFLHDQNIIHRDIKSDNILLDTRGIVKIADLGFSVKVSVNETRKTACGTPYWMSPELVIIHSSLISSAIRL